MLVMCQKEKSTYARAHALIVAASLLDGAGDEREDVVQPGARPRIACHARYNAATSPGKVQSK